MTESESVALPLGDAASFQRLKLYHNLFRLSRGFWKVFSLFYLSFLFSLICGFLCVLAPYYFDIIFIKPLKIKESYVIII